MGKQFLRSLEARIKNDSYIRLIDLRYNRFTRSKPLLEFVPFLEQNASLLCFDLRFNSGFTIEVHKRVAVCLLRNFKIAKEIEGKKKEGEGEENFM